MIFQYLPFVMTMYVTHVHLFPGEGVSVILTLSILFLTSYAIHIVSHAAWYTTFAEKYNPDFIFHKMVHHDPTTGGDARNLFHECVQNFFSTSLLWFPPTFLVLHVPSCIRFGFIYASYHLLNQGILAPRAHELHHQDTSYNYGYDFMDVLFDTKHPLDETYEDLTSGVLNIFVAATLVKLMTCATTGIGTPRPSS